MAKTNSAKGPSPKSALDIARKNQATMVDIKFVDPNDAKPKAATSVDLAVDQGYVGAIRLGVAKVLFADEPTGNLDSTNATTILALLQQLSRENRTSLVMATHSQEIASQADRVLRLMDGRIVPESRHAA